MDKWDLPMSDRDPELPICPECGQEYDQTEEGLTCWECLDAETDALESEYIAEKRPDA